MNRIYVVRDGQTLMAAFTNRSNMNKWLDKNMDHVRYDITSVKENDSRVEKYSNGLTKSSSVKSEMSNQQKRFYR